jgi:S1-C subfamily serine protease
MGVHSTFVHLSGSKRGRIETFDQNLIRIGTAPGCALRFSAVKDPSVLPHHAQIRFENCEFLLTDLAGATGTFVNGRQLTEVILQDGDIIEAGRGGPKLRFRVRVEELATCTPFRVILSDSRAVARASPAGRLDGATTFVIYLVGAVLREASWKVKAAGLGLALFLVALAVGVPVALYKGQRSTERALVGLAGRLQTEQVFREELEQRLSESRQRLEGYRGALGDLVATLRVERQRQATQLAETERKIRALAAEGSAGERIVQTFGAGVALLQGALAFEDPAGRPLRYLGRDQEGQPLRDPFGRAPVSVEGDGPPVRTTFIGTGFLVSQEGAILTSRHVVEPWKGDEGLAAIFALGVRPRLIQLRAFFPEFPDPITVSIDRASEAADLVLLKGDLGGRAVPVLPLDRTGREARSGRPVILIGYPGGVDLLLARVEPAVLQTLAIGRAVDVVSLVEAMGRQRLIRPYATWGHLADVRPHQISYDAETTLGGSGGPIFSPSGRVIGVNYATVPSFASANFGVPIRFGLALLAEAPRTFRGGVQ